jgi:predicted MFS family arabinose efflux permease
MLANFVSVIPPLITSILVIEIAFSFNVEVGIVGQLGTAQSIVSAIMGLLMGALSVKYRHKSLLLVGLVVLSIAGFTCSYAPTFGLLLAGFAITGISSVMVIPMSQALVGSLFSVKDRPKNVGYLMAGFALGYVIGSPLLNYLDDWRLGFLLFLVPLTLVSIVLTIRGIPSTTRHESESQRFFHGFKAVVQNKSAIACLIADALVLMAVRVLHYYSLPFYREHFGVDRALLSFLAIGSSLIYVIGSLLSGRLVNRFGRKPLTVIGALFTGALTVGSINAPSFWLALALMYIGTIAVVVRAAAFRSLALEQVPAYRGTMMSLSQFSYNVGAALGHGLGGFILLTFDYGHLGVLGIAAIIAAVIFHFFAIDPTIQVKQQSIVNP